MIVIIQDAVVLQLQGVNSKLRQQMQRPSDHDVSSPNPKL